jgi:hypothetical protein
MFRADWRFADLGEVGFFIDPPHRRRIEAVFAGLGAPSILPPVSQFNHLPFAATRVDFHSPFTREPRKHLIASEGKQLAECETDGAADIL